MNINDITNVEKYVTSSREILKNQLTEYFKEYMQLDDIEIRKSSLLGYLIQIISILTSNQIFYSSMIYRESTLINAKLTESINDWALYLGYKPKRSQPSTVDVLFQINNDNITNSNIIIDKNFKCYADDVIFTNEHKCEIVNTTTGIQIFLDSDYGKVTIPYSLDSETNTLSFLLTLKQFMIKENNYIIPQDLKQYQFFTQNVPISENNSLYDVEVYIDNELWTNYNNIFEMNSNTKGYIYNFSDKSINITFGNGLFGKQPKQGSELAVFVKETRGKQGNIISGSITKGDRLFKTVGNTSINFSYVVTNSSPGYGGKDEEQPQETKSNAIKNLEAMHRLVSTNDFKNINKIIPIFGEYNKSILKRSDLKCNEILLYSVLQFFIDNYVPTISYYYTIHRTVEKIRPFNIFTFDNETYYYCPFEIVPNYDTYEVNYIYYSRDVFIPLDIQKLNIDISPFSITNLNVTSDFNNRIFKIKLNINNINLNYNLSDYDVKILLDNNGNYKRIINLILDVTDPNNVYYYTELEFDEIITGYINGKLIIDNNATNDNVSEYSFLLNIKIDLYNYTRSQMKKSDGTCSELPYDNRFTIFDIPLIEKTWFDNLNIGNGVDLRNDFEQRLIQNLIRNLDETDIRLCNTYLSNKFVNTIGELTNINLTIPNYNVIDNVTSYDDLITRYDITELIYNNMFLINGDLLSDDTTTKYIQIDDENDKFFKQETKIAKFIKIDNNNTTVWEFIEPINSECIYIQSKDLKLFYDGNEWFKPHYMTPLSITMNVYLNNFNLPYGEYLRDELYEWLKNEKTGIEKNMYRSEIIRFIQSYDNVIYCKLLEPRIDIRFDFDIDKIKHTEILKYSPQFVYYKKELINIKVLPSNRL